MFINFGKISYIFFPPLIMDIENLKKHMILEPF
jgi:hypothetical protein